MVKPWTCGFAALLQAWIAIIADKLEVSFEGYTVTGTGFSGSKAAAAGSKAIKGKAKQ
jgi:hypothetical protein